MSNIGSIFSMTIETVQNGTKYQIKPMNSDFNHVMILGSNEAYAMYGQKDNGSPKLMESIEIDPSVAFFDALDSEDLTTYEIVWLDFVRGMVSGSKMAVMTDLMCDAGNI